jgi:hypothetical protein
MTVEVRQMLIRSLITEDGASTAARDAQAHAQEVKQIREQVLAQCKAWLAEQLRGNTER